MDDNQQRAIFDELHNVAGKIIGDIEGKLNSTREELHGALDDLKTLRDTNRNLSADLAKSQEARRHLEDERNYLREQIYKLSDENRKLSTALQMSQDNLSRTQRENNDLRVKLLQIHRYLAG